MKNQVTITLEKEKDATEMYEEIVRMAKEKGYGIVDIIIKEGK